MTPDEILAAFQRMVRRQDYWRGYIGYEDDSPTDDEVEAVLQRARDCMTIVGDRDSKAFMLDMVPAEELDDARHRIAELERQRDAVLALHAPRVTTGLDGAAIVSEFCQHDDEVMPCPTAAIYGGGE